MRRILCIISAIILLASCRGGDDGVLSVASSQEPQTLDVMMSTSVSGRSIASGNIYEKLISTDAEGHIIPVLAERWELSDDGRELVFRLRSGVRFHDGTALDPGDAAASMNRWLSVYENAESITGDARFTEGDGMISIRASSSIALLPEMIATAPQCAVIMPEESVLDTVSGGLVADAPGTGPYRLEEWVSGSYILLSGNEDYWGSMPEISEIRYSFVPDPVTRRLGLESGLYDFIDTVSSDDIPQLSEKEGITLHQSGENGSIVLVFNKKEGISSDILFRRAAALLSDREELMKACYGDYGYVLRSGYMDGEDSIWDVSSSLDPYAERDEDEGRRLLAMSSYDGSPVRILSSDLTGLDRIALALSSQLEEAGIDTELIILDWASFIEKRRDPSAWDIYVSATSRVTLPIEKNYLFPSSPGGFDDPASSVLLAEIASSPSPEEAASIWQEAQVRLWEYVPVIVPGHYSTVHASVSSLKGIDFTDGYSFREASWE